MDFSLFLSILIVQTFFLAGLISAHPSSSLHRVHRGKRSQLNTADLEKQQENSDSETFQAPSKYLDLDSFPSARMSVRLHSDLSLECEAVGSPVPKIHWLKNGIPLQSQHTSNHEEKTGFVMSKVKSILRLQCILPDDEAEYSCVAQNDHKKIIASTKVVIEEDNSSEDVRPECEYRLPMFFPKSGTSAYISTVETFHMENLGNDVILPCRAEGQSKPKISWLDNHGQPIFSSQRFQVLPIGDLFIRDLRWTDMGEFSCRAENSFGSDLASTFVYPLQMDGI